MAVADEPLLLLDRRLAAWQTALPGLRQVLDRQALLLRQSLTMSRAVATQPFALRREHVLARVREGMPLLNDQPIHLDSRFAFDLVGRLVEVLERQAPGAERPALLGKLVATMRSGQLDPQRLASEAFVRHADHLAEIALELGIDPELLTSVALLAAAPLLRAYAQRVLPVLERLDDGSAEDGAWRRGYCPVCGGWPALAESRGGERTWLLRCAACASGWRARSRACPYCGNDDMPCLHAETLDGGLRCRVAICERCEGYLKVVDPFGAAAPESLALDEVATRFLDDTATERGYHRPGGSGFRIELALPEDNWLDEFGEG